MGAERPSYANQLILNFDDDQCSCYASCGGHHTRRVRAMPGEDGMTNGEIARRLEDIVREFQGFANKTLLREVYDAHQLLFEARIRQLEEQRKEEAAERAAMRKLLVGGIVTFIVTIAAQVVLFATLK